MTEKPRIYVTFEPDIYAQVAAYGEKHRIQSKSEATQDLVRMGLESYAASNVPAPRSEIFRGNVGECLLMADSADIEAWGDYGRVSSILNAERPVTLEEVFDIADFLGKSACDLIQSEDEREDLMTDEEKRVLLDLKERGPIVFENGQSLPNIYIVLKRKGYVRLEYGTLEPDGEGGHIPQKMTVYLTKKGETALEKGDFAAQLSEQMEKVLEQLTPEQAEFLVKVAERMLDPIKAHVK